MYKIIRVRKCFIINVLLLLEVEKLNTYVFIQLHQTVNVTRPSHYIPLWPLKVTHPTGPDKGTFVGLLALLCWLFP